MLLALSNGARFGIRFAVYGMLGAMLSDLILITAVAVGLGAVLEWLTGVLRRISALKDALIFQKITRANARHMLVSLAQVGWIREWGGRFVVPIPRVTVID